MKRRRGASPTPSENEFDISVALAGGAESDNEMDDIIHPSKAGSKLNRDILSTQILVEEDPGEEDEAFIAARQAASNRKASNLKGRTVKRGGGFQAMGLNAALLKAITRKGFSVPTPIQRKTIPLVLDGQDVVGMARTGSGKTAAFVIPMIERLKAHSAKVGARAAILSPSRELALQTLKVVKELGRGADLRTILLVGGDNLEEQFRDMTSNPDIIIATPGRFLHLKVEMKLDLSSIRYVVFDEADRLFEMGFAAQLTEILHGLPSNRQTLLFSATLPKSLVEFARAGLQEPKLVRLDAESKVSPDLESAFFTVKSAEKEGALLQIIQDVIKIPTGPTEAARKQNNQNNSSSKKRKHNAASSGNTDSPTPHSTIIFAATKHHVDYLTSLLRSIGYEVSYVYGSLDQTARKMQVQDFRTGMTNILVVTDVAARGIDIPILSNVINYDFPSQPKVFVHRVGRTARAGRKGWSYSLVHDADVPYLLDLQLFLSKRLLMGRSSEENVNYAEDLVIGSLPRDRLSSTCEWISKLLEDDTDLSSLLSVAVKGEKLYTRTRNAASSESVKRAKEVLSKPSNTELHPLFSNQEDSSWASREDLLARVRGYRPTETVFEIGKRGGTSETADQVRKARSKMDMRRVQAASTDESPLQAPSQMDKTADENPTDDESNSSLSAHADMDDASEDELEIAFPHASKRGRSGGSDPWQESEHFMSYTPRTTNLAEDRGYGVQSGSNSNAGPKADFLTQARHATLDLTNDDLKGFAEPNRARMRWDKKSKNYVSRVNDEDGSRGAKMIRGESGQKIAASLRSGRFEAWRKSNKMERLPRVGETETSSSHRMGKSGPARRYRHNAEKAPKEADKFRDDYDIRKKRVTEAKERRIGKFRDGAGKNELRSVDDVRKQRKLKEQRKEKNARPSKRRKF